MQFKLNLLEVLVRMKNKNYKYYTCRYDRAFKEVFIRNNDTSLLKVLLESILNIKIKKIDIKNNELENDIVNIYMMII